MVPPKGFFICSAKNYGSNRMERHLSQSAWPHLIAEYRRAATRVATRASPRGMKFL
jgi:hypothetical protein